MSILVTSLRQPAVLPTVCPSPSASAYSHEVELTRAVARFPAVPFAGRHRRAAWQGAAAAPAHGGLKSSNLVKRPPPLAAFTSLHSAAAVEAQAGRGEMPRASREKERSRSAAAV